MIDRVVDSELSREYIGLAMTKCRSCFGSGLYRSQKNPEGVVCSCVWRAVFRICFMRFRSCVSQDYRISVPTRPRGPNKTWGMKDQEYVADFFLISKRNLNPFLWFVFRKHFLCEFPWFVVVDSYNRTTAGKEKPLDRGNFFHAVYRIQEKLGREFANIEPFPLYPLDEYFGGRSNDPDEIEAFYPVLAEEQDAPDCTIENRRTAKPVRPPFGMKVKKAGS